MAQLYPTICDPMDCSPPGSSVHGILQARRLEWICHFLFQGIFPTQGSNRHLLPLSGGFFTAIATWEAPGLGNLISTIICDDCLQCACSVLSDSWQPHGLHSPPGSCVHGISQVKKYCSGLPFPSPGGSSRLRDRTCVSALTDSLPPSRPPGKP